MGKRQNHGIRAYRTALTLLVVSVAAGFAVFYWSGREPVATAADPKVAALAECLSAAGAKMYGTVWCAHCRAQKKDFGDAFAKVDYTECSLPDNPRAQADACNAAGIVNYPSWVFADGSKLEGGQTLKTLAAKAGCPWVE